MTDDEIVPNQLRSGVQVPNRLRAGPVSQAPPRGGAGHRDGQPPTPFGPRTDDVLRLLTAVAALEPIEAQRLTSFWKAVPAEARERAHECAQQAATTSGRRRDAHAAQEEALHWLDATPIEGQHRAQPNARGSHADEAEIRRAALPAILDAVAATVLSDVLEPEAREVLLRPWVDAFDDVATRPQDDARGA